MKMLSPPPLICRSLLPPSGASSEAAGLVCQNQTRLFTVASLHTQHTVPWKGKCSATAGMRTRPIVRRVETTQRTNTDAV